MDYPDNNLIKETHQKFLLDGFESLTKKEAIDLINHLHEATIVQDVAKNGLDAAIGFETAIKDVCSEYMAQGLTVTQASGVLSLVKTEIEVSFFFRYGPLKEVIREVVFSTEVGGP